MSKYEKKQKRDRTRYNIDVETELFDDLTRMFGRFNMRTAFFNKLLEGLKRQAVKEGATTVITRVLNGRFKIVEDE